MLILILNYQNNNIYNKQIPASIPFIYKGLMHGFVEKVFYSLIRFLMPGASPNRLLALESRSVRML